MGRSQETYKKKEVRNRKEKKRKEKEQKRLARKENPGSGGPDSMIAYVDENGMITSTPPDPKMKKTIKTEDIEISVPKYENRDVQETIRKGVVTFFNESKGFGFIRDAETGESIFVHVNDLLEAIQENSAVSFMVEMGKKGPVATQVKVVK